MVKKISIVIVVCIAILGLLFGLMVRNFFDNQQRYITYSSDQSWAYGATRLELDGLDEVVAGELLKSNLEEFVFKTSRPNIGVYSRVRKGKIEIGSEKYEVEFIHCKYNGEIMRVNRDGRFVSLYRFHRRFVRPDWYKLDPYTGEDSLDFFQIGKEGLEISNIEFRDLTDLGFACVFEVNRGKLGLPPLPLKGEIKVETILSNKWSNGAYPPKYDVLLHHQKKSSDYKRVDLMIFLAREPSGYRWIGEKVYFRGEGLKESLFDGIVRHEILLFSYETYRLSDHDGLKIEYFGPDLLLEEKFGNTMGKRSDLAYEALNDWGYRSYKD